MSLFILFIVLLFVAAFIDFWIRKYINYQALINNSTTIAKLYEAREKDLIKNVESNTEKMITIYGIRGSMDLPIDFSKPFTTRGNITVISPGSVIEKIKIDKSVVLKQIEQMTKAGVDKKSLSFASDDIMDKYIIKILSKVDGLIFSFNNKDIFENVKQGDDIYISHDTKQLKTVTFIGKDLDANGTVIRADS